MEKYLVTGFSGFVSRHFVQFLYDNGVKSKILGIDIKKPEWDIEQYNPLIMISMKIIDMMDYTALEEAIQAYNPDYILHLASYSSVAYSWRNPSDSFINNTNIFLNLLEAVRKNAPKCRILSIGSSEEYGNVCEESLPLRENQAPNPCSPYAVARVSQEMLSRLYVTGYHMNIVLTRSFNHIGTWQDERFVIPGFIRKVLELKKAGNNAGVITTGDLSIRRDFVDVRDVVRAYYLLLMKGISGEIYNICSGRDNSLTDILTLIADKVGVGVTGRIDPELVRPNDNKVIVGSAEKIYSELGWKPIFSLETTISDMIECILEN